MYNNYYPPKQSYRLSRLEEELCLAYRFQYYKLIFLKPWKNSALEFLDYKQKSLYLDNFYSINFLADQGRIVLFQHLRQR